MVATTCANAELYLRELHELIGKLDCVAIDAVSQHIFEVWTNDGLVLTMGNGGSAFTASHFVTDLVKTAAVDGHRRLRALSLADNTGLLTAIGNDIAYEQSFVYSLESYARVNDLAIVISASGNSPNIVTASQWAKEHGVLLVALTGFSGGEIGSIADVHVNVPSNNYGTIEDLHLSIGHMISQKLRSMVLCNGIK